MSRKLVFVEHVFTLSWRRNQGVYVLKVWQIGVTFWLMKSFHVATGDDDCDVYLPIRCDEYGGASSEDGGAASISDQLERGDV